MELEIGMYVRTKNNKIYKIIDKKFDETILVDLYQTDISGYLMEIDIKKSSPNIIDLIEVGDYVNGERVINIIKKHKYLEVSDEEVIIDEKDIKSIVTKEVFERMEYRIGE